MEIKISDILISKSICNTTLHRFAEAEDSFLDLSFARKVFIKPSLHRHAELQRITRKGWKQAELQPVAWIPPADAWRCLWSHLDLSCPFRKQLLYLQIICNNLSHSPLLCRPHWSLISHITFLLHLFLIACGLPEELWSCFLFKTSVFSLAVVLSLCLRLCLWRDVISCGQNVLLNLHALLVAPAPAPARGFFPSREIQKRPCAHSHSHPLILQT